MWIECEVFEGDWEVIRMKKAGWGQIVEGLKGQELHFRKIDTRRSGVRKNEM